MFILSFQILLISIIVGLLGTIFLVPTPHYKAQPMAENQPVYVETKSTEVYEYQSFNIDSLVTNLIPIEAVPNTRKLPSKAPEGTFCYVSDVGMGFIMLNRS